MSIIVLPNTFTVGAVIVAAQQNSNFSTIYNDYNGNIDNTNISASAGITNNQLAQITTASKVSGAALTLLPNVPAGAGLLPGVNGGVPSGCIFMWHGSIASIPSGYVLCDGTNSTPDLRNRFIVAADADVVGVANSTITGSALQTSEGQIPAHTHTVNAFHTGGGSGVSDGQTTSGTPQTTSSTGTGTANVARFYALAYIMKS